MSKSPLSQIFFCTTILASAFYAFAAETPTQKSDTTSQVSWIGKPFNDYSELASNLYTGAGITIPGSGWTLESWMQGKVDLLVATKPGSIPEQRIVVDAVKVTTAKGKRFLFVAECVERKTGRPVGAIASKVGSKFPKIFQAWLPDTLMGKLVPIDPKSVKCHSDEDIAE